MSEYWYSRWLFERALAAIYLVAFLAAAQQFVPLLGERGLEPIGRFVQAVPFRASPSLFHYFPRDEAFRVCAWLGVALSVFALTSIPQRLGVFASAAVWAGLWLLYLSFVNVGQNFYGFGWETLLLEVGFLTIFAGSSHMAPNMVFIWLQRWILFRLMFGAGLIKLHGDACWRDLTCLNYYFETQPMPNALSWFFHWLPPVVHRVGVVFNHFAEVIVPFAYFAPQPFAATAGLITIVFQLGLIISGNLSWLNWLTIVLCIPLIGDRWLSWLPVTAPPALSAAPSYQLTLYVLAAIVAFLSISPVVNMLSSRQMMNASFDPLHLVNTYGAFGTVTRERFEIVLEGTDEPAVTAETPWQEYEFKGKPGHPAWRPPQVAPYHLRLDWLMWFEAMAPTPQSPWFFNLVTKLLEGDKAVLGLMRTNPFPDRPPRYIRAQYYLYKFTTPDQRSATRLWWHRQLVGTFYGPASLTQ